MSGPQGPGLAHEAALREAWDDDAQSANLLQTLAPHWGPGRVHQESTGSVRAYAVATRASLLWYNMNEMKAEVYASTVGLRWPHVVEAAHVTKCLRARNSACDMHRRTL